MNEAEQLAALEASVGQVATDLASATTAIQTELNELATANPQLDLTKLTEAVNGLDPTVKAIGELKPAPAEPTA